MPKFCPVCGNSLQNENGEICPQCGARLAMPPAPITPEKNPVVAALLSVFVPGLGQVYNGDLKRGILFYLGTLIATLFLIIPGIIVWAYQLWDAYSTAKMMNSGEIPFRDVNSTELILFIILAGIGILIWIVIFVAVTIILSAVIAAFVFGMAGTISETKVVAVTAQQPDSNHIMVTYQGGADNYQLRKLETTVTDAQGYSMTKTMEGSWSSDPPEVGSTITFAGSYSGKDHVVTVGEFSDGTSQVVLDTFI